MFASLVLPFLGTIITIFIGLFLHPYISNTKLRRAISKIPGPPTHGYLLGNIPDIPKERHLHLAHLQQLLESFQQNDLFAFHMGPIPTVNVIGPTAVKEILSSSRHTTKSSFYDFFHPWLGTGLLTSSGSKWKSRRRLITPAFHFDVLQRFLEVMNEQSDVMVKRMREEASKEENGRVEAFELITACALDIICETAMGKKVNAQSVDEKLPYVDAVYEMSKCITYRIENPIAFNDFIYSLLPNGRVHSRCLKQLHAFTLEVIRDRKKLWEEDEKMGMTAEEIGRKRRLAFLDMLLKANVEGESLTDEDIREEVDTFMFEGHDTTSANLGFSLHLIGAHPEVQKKLQAEVDEVMGDESEVSFEMLGKLKYMDLFLKETLRLYPSVPIIGRITTEDVTINGFKIPEGTTVSVSIAGIHRNPRYWDRPTEFIPERWENEEEKDPFLYIPFSAGPRNCIGQKFAHNEEKVILSKILKNFNLTALAKEPQAFPEIIMRPINGIWLTLQERNST